tara:strand:+ start:482 stop:1192 length:711 start_codon:yes stop_codon:yes gene_type:complete
MLNKKVDCRKKKHMSKKICNDTKKKYKGNTDKLGIIVLDLDETLFHTKNSQIHYRPHLKNFLIYLNKFFYLVVYTAALKQYADKILNKIYIDSSKNITAKSLFVLKLYRNSLTTEGKDLKVVLKKLLQKKLSNNLFIPNKYIYKQRNGKIVFNLNNIILIDNLKENFVDNQFFNGIPVKDFYQNNKDTTLLTLKNFFKSFLKQKLKDKSLTLKKYLYSNIYKINDVLKVKYNKCKI